MELTKSELFGTVFIIKDHRQTYSFKLDGGVVHHDFKTTQKAIDFVQAQTMNLTRTLQELGELKQLLELTQTLPS